MNSETFTVRCGECQRNVIVDAVSEFHNVGGFRGYSYTVECECGVISHHDGVDGERIPDSLKLAAANRDAYFVIDFGNVERAGEVPLPLVATTHFFANFRRDRGCQFFRFDFFAAVPDLAIHFQVAHIAEAIW